MNKSLSSQSMKRQLYTTIYNSMYIKLTYIIPNQIENTSTNIEFTNQLN